LQIKVLFAEASRSFNLRRVYDGPVSSCQHGASEKVGKIAIKIASRRFREKWFHANRIVSIRQA
jgi:hypothetical protein